MAAKVEIKTFPSGLLFGHEVHSIDISREMDNKEIIFAGTSNDGLILILRDRSLSGLADDIAYFSNQIEKLASGIPADALNYAQGVLAQLDSGTAKGDT